MFLCKDRASCETKGVVMLLELLELFKR